MQDSDTRIQGLTLWSRLSNKAIISSLDTVRKPLLVVFNLHNLHSAAGRHFFYPQNYSMIHNSPKYKNMSNRVEFGETMFDKALLARWQEAFRPEDAGGSASASQRHEAGCDQTKAQRKKFHSATLQDAQLRLSDEPDQCLQMSK